MRPPLAHAVTPSPSRPSVRLSRLLASICGLTLLAIAAAWCLGRSTSVAAMAGLLIWTIAGVNVATWGDPQPEDEY